MASRTWGLALALILAAAVGASAQSCPCTTNCTGNTSVSPLSDFTILFPPTPCPAGQYSGIASARIATTDGSRLRITLTDNNDQALVAALPATTCFNLIDYYP